MTKPNIVFLIIDSFRSDKFFGNSKTSKTPNIDNLITRGSYFKQTISSADATILSWSSIFTCKFPFKTGVRSEKLNKLNKNVITIFDILKKNNYNLYAYIPTLSKLTGMFPKFENEDCYYDYFKGISNGLGEKIINKLQSITSQSQWLFLIHALDLHYPITIPREYDSDVYGTNYYERKVSFTDVWIGKIISKINFDNTILILTSDHGSYIQSITINDKYFNFDYSPNLRIFTSQISKKVPKFLQPIKDQIFIWAEKNIENKKSRIIKNLDIDPQEKRALAGKLEKDHFLFDEKIKVPLLFVGPKIPKGIIIDQQVRTVDIFPTLLELIGVEQINRSDGVSLLPLMKGEKLMELPAYIESNPLIELESDDVIGVRTSKYKYFRDKNDPKKRIHLYNLEKDPLENENLNHNCDIVNEMEMVLENILKDTPENVIEDFEETKKIEKELKKLGYM